VHDRVDSGRVTENRAGQVSDHDGHAGRQRLGQLLVDLLGVGHVDLLGQHDNDRHDLRRLIIHA